MNSDSNVKDVFLKINRINTVKSKKYHLFFEIK